jgi:predicted Zn finger-like uncharacterized protein
MFTQCPECHTVYNVKAKQLRKNRGIFRCKTCSAQFDALQLISETAPKKTSQSVSNPEVRTLWEAPRGTTSNVYWSAAFFAALLVLAAQFFYFESRNLAQNAAVRPRLEQACAVLGCRLPVYRNIRELDILHSALQLKADRNYRLQAALVNRAGFAQAYPQLKLILTDFNGDSFAERIFLPQEYLPQNPQALLAAGADAEIGLDIAAPEVPVGGYLIELL